MFKMEECEDETEFSGAPPGASEQQVIFVDLTVESDSGDERIRQHVKVSQTESGGDFKVKVEGGGTTKVVVDDDDDDGSILSDTSDFTYNSLAASSIPMQESSSDSESEQGKLSCGQCSGTFSTKSNLAKHLRLGRCKPPKKKYTKVFPEDDENKENKLFNESDHSIFSNQRRLLPSLWANYNIEKTEKLPYDIDGECVYELSYDPRSMMSSSKDGRPWNAWHSSKRTGFAGIRRVASCGGTYECKSRRCPYFHSYEKPNKVQFKKVSEEIVACSCCGYEADAVPCAAKKVWEFSDNTVLVYHCGKHTCVAKKEPLDITEEATKFFHANTYAKPSQFPFERLRGMLKEGKSVDDVYAEAKGLANLKKIQNIKQKVIQQENPVGHSFEALAKIKESSDKIDRYLLWSVEDGRVSQSKMTAVFRSSKERIEIISQMQRGGTHSLGNEYCFLDAEHDKVKGMKTINLSVQHPVLKECVTLASMDCMTESTETLCKFWRELNSALREYTGDRNYVFDPEGIVTDEHGGNRESIRVELKPGTIERAKSCELHFYDCAHKVSKAEWSPKSRAEFITMVHSIYTAETPGAYEARRRALLDWAEKPKRTHVKPWFNNFWHLRRFHVFRAFKGATAPNTNMAEVGHSRNATRGAKNDTLARVAEDHIVESALLKAKLDRYEDGCYLGGRCAEQKRKDEISLRRQLDRAAQFANELKEGAVSSEQYNVRPYIREDSGHRVNKRKVTMQSQPDDLSSSSDSDKETNSVHKNAKKAFRKRSTRSIKFKESLRMAKQTTLRLVQIHHVSPAKKIFEVDHYGKQRLVEIAETVSCNCSFASKRDLCLHTIWVMMHVLKVNETDDVLHQKSHSRETVLGLFRRLRNVPTATTTNPENQGLHVRQVLSQVPLSSSLQMEPSSLQMSQSLQNATAVPQHVQLSGNLTAFGFSRQPWQNNNPFILYPIDNKIKKCAACHFEFRDPLGPMFLGVVLQHKEKYIFTKPDGTQQVTPEQNRYYHCELQCLKSRHPYFKPSLVQLHPELLLCDFQKDALLQKIGLAV